MGNIKLSSIRKNNQIVLGNKAWIMLEEHTDPFENTLNILTISNGILTFTVIMERSMDIGEIFYKGKKVSWNRSKDRLLHPDSVDLKEEGAWEKGFYQAVASLGPEVFGTPDRVRTPHGTGAYSKVNPNTVNITEEEGNITVSGIVDIKGYSSVKEYDKEVYITLKKDSCFFERKETYRNLSKETLPIDDGYHIQLCGDFVKDGGMYVLPVPSDKMLLRDHAPSEISKKAIYSDKTEFLPIRCYQYVPEKVYGIEEIPAFKDCEFLYREPDRVTAEMIVDRNKEAAGFVIRPLSSFPRTLLAKRNDGESMYAIEPCKSRPNSIKQKEIDGELMYIEPGEGFESEILIGFSDDKETIEKLYEKIESAASYEKEIAEIRRKEK